MNSLIDAAIDSEEVGGAHHQELSFAEKVYRKSGALGLGEAYIAGEWESPKLDKALYTIFTTISPPRSLTNWFSLATYFAKERFFNLQRGKGIFTIAKRHYDLGNDLFQTMLDTTMTYSCGYWKEADSLLEAQNAKLELICQKLKLKPGMKVLDIGCGWGNFAKYAAENYGVTVTGITVSEEQVKIAQESCKGLPVEIRLQDYQEITGKFDRIVSIEMIEAVGRRNLDTYYSVVNRCLKESGLFLVQSISAETFSRTSNPHLDSYILWILKYIFPNGYLPKTSELVKPCRNERSGEQFVIQDWHSFGPDYDKTLLAWAENFENGWEGLKEKYGEAFYRIWKFYLYGCAALFRARIVNLYQIVYSKPQYSARYESVR